MFRSLSKKTVVILFFNLALTLPTLAHKGHLHGAPVAAAPQGTDPRTVEQASAERAAKLNIIGTSYLSRVKPIFQKSCFDCHSNQPRYPSYYRIPGVKQLIDSDIAESKEHFNFSNDFPFDGHGTPEEDFKAIIDEISSGDMPPFRYRMMHPAEKLTDQDKKIILDWAQESAATLAKPAL